MLNEKFFDTWSQDMSYILGFITGDGSVNKYYLRFALSTKDICILEYIKSQLSSDKKITTVDRVRHVKHLSESSLEIGSIALVNKLAEFHIIPNKTGKEKLPLIPDEYKWDYFRGIFDADGCIDIRGKNSKRIRIASKSKEFLQSLIDVYGYGTIQDNNGCYVLYVGKIKEVNEIRDMMYSSNTFCLERKKLRFYQ